MLVPENCKAVEDFNAGRITSAQMWSIIRRNIHIEVEEPEEFHHPKRMEAVYDINRKGKGQPNGYILDVMEWGEDGQCLVRFYDNDQSIIRTGKMDWISQYKRWEVERKRSTYFRDLKARRNRIILTEL
jgi:malate synthase